MDDWERFEKHIPTFAHNILYIKEKEICPIFISKINSNCKKQIILLKKRKTVLSYSKTNHLHYHMEQIKGDFSCLNCLHSFRTENKIKSYEKVCKKSFSWNCNAIRKE